MSNVLEVTYYYHSGFSCAMGDVLCIFDYWEGEYGELDMQRRITPEMLDGYRLVYVFVSHDHPDHISEEAFGWANKPNVTFIMADDMEVGPAGGHRVKAGDELSLEGGVRVRVFESTDLGVSYLVEMDGINLFHAGDLNFWHWREESTPAEIDEAEREFHRIVETIRGEKLDVAFFPVDPRQGRMYDAGANYFILSVKPRLLVPMHYWGRVEIAREFARRSRCRDTEVFAMTRQGDRLRLEFADDGFMTINVLEPVKVDGLREPEGMGGQTVPGPVEYGQNPFTDTDMPVDLGE